MVLRKMERKKLNLKDLREIPEVGLEKSQENPKKKRIRRNLRMSKLRKRMKVLLLKGTTEATEKIQLILMWILKGEKRKNQGRNLRRGGALKISDLDHAQLAEEEEAVAMVEGRGQGKE